MKNGRAGLSVVDVAVSDLRAWPRNPRRIKPARLEQLQVMLAASPEMLQARPLIALPDGTVIAGNQRLAAVIALGWERVPVVYADLDEAEAARWAFADNNQMGESDDTLAAELLAELEAGGSPLELTGFESGEIDRLLRSIARSDRDPDAAPEPPAEPRSVRGEVYELGSHRLMCGDATNAGEVMALLDGERPTLGIADPPYNVDEDYETYDDDRLEADYAAFTQEWFPLLAEVSERQIVTPGWNNLPLWCRLHRFRAIAVWTKSNAMTRGSISRFNTWEPILFFGEGWLSRERASDVFEIPVRQQPGGAGRPINGVAHPCPKPVELWQELAQIGATGSIFDPFAGAGTALIAAEILERRCFAMELDPAYCDVIRQRYADYVGDQQWAP